jgi:exonuclease VII large subunit
VLERGYSVVRGVDGSIVNTAKKAITHKQLDIEFSDGKIKVRHE